MKKHARIAFYAICAAMALFSFVSCGSSSSDDDKLTIIDHESLDASKIPDSCIAAIKGLDVYFEHASVGSNVASGLQAMAATARYDIPRNSIIDDIPLDYGPMISWYGTNNGFLDVARGNP